MATTTNYGWTTPDDTALVKDGAAAIRTLGTSVDTTTKNLNPSTTLGDIEYRSSTANTNTRLGIGSTGQVLTVASGVPSWATSSATPPLLGQRKVGSYNRPNTVGDVADSVAIPAGYTFYLPVYLSAGNYDRIAIKTASTHTSTSVMRLGMYNVNASGEPSTVLFDAGTVSCTAANTVYTITISQTLTAGFYYMAFNCQSATGNRQFWAISPQYAQFATPFINTDLVSQTSNSDYYQTGVTGAFATASPTGTTGGMYIIGMRQS
jgi:hypothetical protein